MLFRSYPKVTIKRKHLSTALDGDTVQVKLLALKKEKKVRGEVIKVTNRINRIFIGTLEFDGNFNFLIPDDNKYYVDFLVPTNKLKGAKSGDKVSAKFLSWTDPQKSPQAEVIEILGKAGEPKTEYLSVIKDFALPDSFPAKALEETKLLPLKISAADIIGRLDYRKELVITIDPEDAKDFDDALSLKKLDNGNFQLGVHIADVSHYVKENSEIDKEALNRGTSVYLVDQVVPMLPELLSNEICSLKPRRVRLTFSVIMEINSEGEVLNYEIAESVINSKRRFSYIEVQKIIETGEGDYKELVLELDKLAKTLRERRFKKGGIDLQTVEVKFILDSNKKPTNALLRESNDSTQLVEECMLVANKTVAEHIKKLSAKFKLKTLLPFLYRVHDEPLPEKIADIVTFIKSITKSKFQSSANLKDINRLIKQFEGKPEKPIVHQLLVRSMPKAEYTNENIGHFGLGFSDYTHFTSPIRRYPDLVVHRLIKRYNTQDYKKENLSTLSKKINEIGLQTTASERFAMEVERASVKLAQTVLSNSYLGKEFNGTISGIVGFGLFVMLDDIYAEGLLHIKDLNDDYYIFDEKNFRLVGKRFNKVFHFGKRIRVKIINVNIEKRKVDLR